MWLPDAALEHRFAPNVDFTFKNDDGEIVNYRSTPVGANGVCFRDDGIDGEVFAVAVGDSFTFGHDTMLDAAWVEQVEKAIGADVVNLGMTNIYGSTQIQRTLEIHGMRHRPRLIIWAAYVNDWYEDTIFLSWEAIARPLKGQFDYPRSTEIYDAMRRHIYIRPPVNPGDEAQNPALGARVMYEGNGLRLECDATSYAAQDLRLPSIARGWASTREALLRAKALAASIRAEFLVIPIPAKEHVYHERVCTVLEYARSQDPAVFCSAYETFCKENDIRCLNPFKSLSDRGRLGEKLYFTVDGHFNRAGHTALAELILAYLDSEHLRPARQSNAPD